MKSAWLFLLLASFSLAGRPVKGAIPEQLADSMESATLHLDFETAFDTPIIGHAVVSKQGTAETVSLAEGGALRTENGGKLRFKEGSGGLDFLRPGSLSFWVSPRGWQWGMERPYNAFFSANWEGGGKLVITRQGLLQRPGEPVSRLDRILVSVSGLPDVHPFSVSLGASDPQHWVDASWHLLVLTWNGSAWSVSLDGGVRKHFSLAAPPQVANFSLGGTREPTCFKAFTIFNRELSDAERGALYRWQNPRP